MLYYYHKAKNSDEEKTLEFTHQVLWGSGGTSGVLHVAASSLLTLISILIGAYAFKKFISENERILNTTKQYLNIIDTETIHSADLATCKQSLTEYKQKINVLKQYLDGGGNIVRSDLDMNE